MYKVPSTWMHLLKLNINCRYNFARDFLETGFYVIDLLDSIEPHFWVSRQNGLTFLTQYLDFALYTMDKPVFEHIVCFQ